ncbi:MAG: transporter [Saprospiraceae bacterium]|nr:transporter [Candidatus Vicinibacter affinis]
MKRSLLFLLTITFIVQLKAQTPIDNLMMPKGQICVAAIYSHDSWNEYWEGTLKRTNGNIGTLNRQSVMPMFSLGLTDKINFMAALPWVKTKPTAGQFSGDQGIQDLGLWVKAELIRQKLGPGSFLLHTTLGLTTPVSDYNPDYLPFSIGLGATEASLRGMLQYEFDFGLFIRGMYGYHRRSEITLERDYYYTDRGYYSNKVDMPNATTFNALIGMWLFNKGLRIEANYDGMTSLSGHDIRRQDMPFPSNKMNNRRIGFGFQYYPTFVKGLSIIGSGNFVLEGRNVGQSTIYSGGVAYQFGLWNKQSNNSIQ